MHPRPTTSVVGVHLRRPEFLQVFFHPISIGSFLLIQGYSTFENIPGTRHQIHSPNESCDPAHEQYKKNMRGETCNSNNDGGRHRRTEGGLAQLQYREVTAAGAGPVAGHTLCPPASGLGRGSVHILPPLPCLPVARGVSFPANPPRLPWISPKLRTASTAIGSRYKRSSARSSKCGDESYVERRWALESPPAWEAAFLAYWRNR